MERLRARAKQLGIDLSDRQLDMFNTYYEMLIETNKVMNLTAITEIDEVITKHFIDSVSLVKAYPVLLDYQGFDNNNNNDDTEVISDDLLLKNNKSNTEDYGKTIKVLDLGTGAGFPGIPLKIVFPKLQLVLMDSLNKRVKFLQSVIDELGLTGIEAVHGRAEEMARQKNYREQFDLCVSRAVANLSTLGEYCIPFVNVGGKFISYKSADIDEELNNADNAIKTLGGKLTAVNKLTLPDSDIERAFVIIDKVKKTSKTYPRKAGTASKSPL